MAFQNAFNANDANAIGALVTDDAVFMPPNEQDAVGKSNIVARYASQFASLKTTFSSTSIETSVSGPIAYLRFNYIRSDVPKAGGPTVVTYGRDVMILEQQPDGTWKIWRSIFNILPTG